MHSPTHMGYNYGYTPKSKFITVTKVRTGQDALNLMAQVVAALQIQYDSSKWKSMELWQGVEAKEGLSIDNIVKMFQQMRTWAQEAKNEAVDADVLEAARWFYHNVENPSKANAQTKQPNIDPKTGLPAEYNPLAFYEEPMFWVYTGVGTVVLLGGFLWLRNR